MREWVAGALGDRPDGGAPAHVPPPLATPRPPSPCAPGSSGATDNLPAPVAIRDWFGPVRPDLPDPVELGGAAAAGGAEDGVYVYMCPADMLSGEPGTSS